MPAGLVAAVIGGLLVLQPPVKHSYRILKTMAANRIEQTGSQSGSSARQDLVPLASCTGQPSNVHVPASSCMLLDDLLGLQKDGRIPSSGTILNTSELTPVNAPLGYHTAIGNPLWYDTRTVLFERERQRIVQEVDQGLYDLVIVQGVHGGMTGFHHDLLERLEAADGYSKLNDGYAGPSAVPKCRRKDGSCTIHVFFRQPGD